MAHPPPKMSAMNSSQPKQKRPKVTRTLTSSREARSLVATSAPNPSGSPERRGTRALTRLAERRGVPVSTLARDILMTQLAGSDESTGELIARIRAELDDLATREA